MKSARCFASVAFFVFLTQAPTFAQTTTILDTTPVGKKGSVVSDWPGATFSYPDIETLCDEGADLVRAALDGDSEAQARGKKEAKRDASSMLHAGVKLYLVKKTRVRCSPDPGDAMTGEYTIRSMVQVRVTDPKSPMNGTTVWVPSTSVGL